MTEQYLESHFVAWCKQHDAIAVKGPANLAKGFPDRFVALPNGAGTIYVEFKGTSYYGLQPMQKYWQKVLKNSDPYRYFVIDTKEQVLALESFCEVLIKEGPKFIEKEKEIMHTLLKSYDIIFSTEDEHV
jgi:hypothetical protein